MKSSPHSQLTTKISDRTLRWKIPTFYLIFINGSYGFRNRDHHRYVPLHDYGHDDYISHPDYNLMFRSQKLPLLHILIKPLHTAPDYILLYPEDGLSHIHLLSEIPVSFCFSLFYNLWVYVNNRFFYNMHIHEFNIFNISPILSLSYLLHIFICHILFSTINRLPPLPDQQTVPE